MPLSPRRRSLLITGSVALLAGCSGREAEQERARAEQAQAADRLRRRAAGQSAALLGRYDATLTAHPALAERLTPLRANVAQHLKALGGKPEGKAGGRAAGTDERAVPQDEQGALAALADAERRTADARTKALDGATPEFARLLASVAAAGGAHAYLLTEGA